MVVVLVKWYIRKGEENRFKEFWRGMHPDSNDGLFNEFFSKPIDDVNPNYHSLDVESTHYVTFINVGVWRSVDDFDNAIGKKIPAREQHPKDENKEIIALFNFEYKLRERIIMNVEERRPGAWNLNE